MGEVGEGVKKANLAGATVQKKPQKRTGAEIAGTSAILTATKGGLGVRC